MEQNSVNLTKGPIVGPLIRFSLPILLALLLLHVPAEKAAVLKMRGIWNFSHCLLAGFAV